MRRGIYTFLSLFAFVFSAETLSAQSSSGSTNYFIYALIGIGVIIVLSAISMLAGNLLEIEAQKHGVDLDNEGESTFGQLKSMFGKSVPTFADKRNFHELKKGHDIKLKGKATGAIQDVSITRFSVSPKSFNGISPIPKVLVQAGDEVKAGQVLFFDKKRPEVKYVSPVSGEVVEVTRAEKRSIADVIILADKEQSRIKHDIPSLSDTSREDLVSFLQESGAWTLFDQRPFNILPGTEDVPANIFISTFDSAPLAPNANVVAEGKGEAFQKGIDVLNCLTEGKVYLGLDASSNTPSSVFTQAENAEKHWFRGKHPAGNVGVQIHHIAPITKTSKVWTLGVQEVISLGSLFLTGSLDMSRVVAITGAPLAEAKYVRTYQGANISDLLKDQGLEEGVRILSGDVLSGKEKAMDGFLNFRDDQITVLEEGDDYELFGWLLPLAPRPSVSKTFPGFLMPNFEFEANTNTHGEKRAFVVTGQYEKVLPMDIYPQHLMKAILTGNIERMEGLGITELAEEDIALCEFVCTSKQPLQKILRDGLTDLQEQL